MARFRLTNPLVTADSSVQQNFEGIQGYLNKLAPTVPVVTSLPTSPADGTVIDYVADSANGVVWRFRYRAASGSSYKWEFVGGSPLTSEVATSETRSANTFAALTTPGPSLTAPLAGDYAVTIAAAIEANLTAGWRGRMTFGGTNADSVMASGTGAAGSPAEGAHASRSTKRTLTAAQTLTCLYKSDAANTVSFADRTLSIVPVRVG